VRQDAIFRLDDDISQQAELMPFDVVPASRSRRIVLCCLAILAVAVAVNGRSASAAQPLCSSAGDGGFDGSAVVGGAEVSGSCSTTTTDLPGPGGVPVVVIDCGYATAGSDTSHWNKKCGPTGFPCPPIPGDPAPPHQFVTAIVNGSSTTQIEGWCAGADTPAPSAAALRDEVIRLLPTQPLAMSPNRGTTLVNFKTLFWVRTPIEIQLGRSTLIGFPVDLRARFDHADWDFGDGTSTSSPTADPGTPYHTTDDCGRCSDRFGHLYRTTGKITATATVYWTAQFRIGGGQWIDIPGVVTPRPPLPSLTFQVRQARGVLVAGR
jgi:hypothetical protein